MEVLESVLGYSFRDPRLLQLALTHASIHYRVEQAERNHQADNQRLEFLGDAVLQLTLSDILYQRLPKEDEGRLTKLRAQLVSAKALASTAKKLNLGSHLLMGRGEDANGGRERESALSDAMEAVTGAVYLDGGLEAVQQLVRRLFLDDLEKLLLTPGDQNPKGQLQELIQAVGPVPPQYCIVESKGPDHAKHFRATVSWLGGLLGSGSGPTKKAAEADSAREALKSEGLAERLQALGEEHFKATKISGKTCEQAANKSPQPCDQLS